MSNPTIQSLIVFGEDWGMHPSSTQHLMAQLQDRYTIVWFNSLGLRRPRLSRSDCLRALRKARAMMQPARQSGSCDQSPAGQFPVIAPRIIPWPGLAFANAVNRHALARQIRAQAARHNLGHFAIWASLPTAQPAIDAFPDVPVIYYCGDDFSALAGVDHAPVTAMETRLAARADLVLVASETLATKFSPEKTHVLPHGFHADRFCAPARRAPELSQLPAGPIAGFYGALESWIDVARLAGAARALPAWQFALIGPVRTDISVLAHLPNVHMLGPKPHDRLSQFSQHWQVSLLPFRDCAQITSCNPLKLREYLAAGTPIAAAIDFPALAPYRRLVHVAANHDFAQTITAAGDDGARNDTRRAAVAGQSWTARATDVARMIDVLQPARSNASAAPRAA